MLFNYFYFSSFDAVTTATETGTSSVDNAGAPAKDGSKVEAADGTAGTTGSSTPSPRRKEEVAPLHRHHSSNSCHIHRQIKINMMLEGNLMSFSSISLVTCSAWRFFYRVCRHMLMETCTMVNVYSGW